MTRIRLPVLAYHSINISGNDYGTNDHHALESDLRALTALGLKVIGAPRVVRAMREGRLHDFAEGFVVLTFDDGQNFDFYDLPHPTWGDQPSFHTILRAVAEGRDRSAQPYLHATSFAIVSPDARKILDQTCMLGCGWWTDEWWPLAVRTGLLSIGNHSWDHNHPTLPATVSSRPERGTFRTIDSFGDAEAEIAQASRYLRGHADNEGAGLFAYPYGESNGYLVREYFPQEGKRIGIDAAFGCSPEPITGESDIWDLPRFVCGLDWKSASDFETMIRGAI